MVRIKAPIGCALVGYAALVLSWLLFCGAIGYTVGHFIRKFW